MKAVPLLAGSALPVCAIRLAVLGEDPRLLLRRAPPRQGYEHACGPRGRCQGPRHGGRRAAMRATSSTQLRRSPRSEPSVREAATRTSRPSGTLEDCNRLARIDVRSSRSGAARSAHPLCSCGSRIRTARTPASVTTWKPSCLSWSDAGAQRGGRPSGTSYAAGVTKSSRIRNAADDPESTRQSRI